MVLVAGATGLVGGEVCRLLRAQGRAVRALVRPAASPEKVSALAAAGCEIAVGNLRDRASLEAACAGAEAVVCTASAMPFSWSPPENTIETVDLAGVKRLVESARVAGVRHMVHTTISGHIDLDFPLRNAKRAAEAHLRQSGLTYTILRPSYFMEVWLSPAVGFDAAGAHATIYGSGHRRLSWISLVDVARFAVASLSNPAAVDATLEIGGPEALSPLEVVTIFEEVGGRNFDTVFVPEEALAAQQAAAPDDMQRSFAGLMRCYAAGDVIFMQGLARAFPITMTTVREYAARALGRVGAPA